jgi:hypothetical protein
VRDGIDARFPVEPDRIDHQRVTFPAANRVAEPSGIGVFGMRAAIDCYGMEPRILLPQKSCVFIVLDNLEGMRSSDRTQPAGSFPWSRLWQRFAGGYTAGLTKEPSRNDKPPPQGGGSCNGL